jgi:hypothetical protein
MKCEADRVPVLRKSIVILSVCESENDENCKSAQVLLRDDNTQGTESVL